MESLSTPVSADSLQGKGILKLQGEEIMQDAISASIRDLFPVHKLTLVVWQTYCRKIHLVDMQKLTVSTQRLTLILQLL